MINNRALTRIETRQTTPLCRRTRRRSAGSFLAAVIALLAYCAGAASASAIAQEPPGPGQLASTFQRLQAKVVKVYGAGVGRVDGFSAGIAVSPEGDILTVQGPYLEGTTVRVVMADASIEPAQVVRRDRNLQVAHLKINRATPDFFHLSSTAVGMPGDWVLAVGNAFKVADGREPLSAQLGVISLRTSIEARFDNGDIAYAGPLVVIDAITSNPGSGGGAVVTAEGDLVGMIGKIITSTETNTRLNYAVPAAKLLEFMSGSAEGIAGAESGPPETAAPASPVDLGIRLFRVGGNRGPAYIDKVIPGSRAARAALQPDDLIISLDSQRVDSIADFDRIQKTLGAGGAVVLVIKRGNELLRVELSPEDENP